MKRCNPLWDSKCLPRLRDAPVVVASDSGDGVKSTIREFMWGFQQHFRSGVARDIERALSKIGWDVKARIVLVGLAKDAGARQPICVEPEEGPLQSSALVGIRARAERLLAVDPESQITVSDPRHRKLRERALADRSVAAALTETFEASGAYRGLKFFASTSSPVNGYDVYVLLGLPAIEFEAFPALEGDCRDRVPISQSLQHEVISQCLRRASSALFLPDAGAAMYPLNASTEEIVLSAAVRFVDSVAFRIVGNPADLYHSVSAFSKLNYERTAAASRRLLVQNQPEDALAIRFREPVRLRDARTMRKLLELSDATNAVISDATLASGLGAAQSSGSYAEVLFDGLGRWRMSVDDLPLIQVENGEASLPATQLRKERFNDIGKRVLGNEIAVDTLWKAIEVVRSERSGMTLVVSAEPEQEALRLGGQLVAIDAVPLNAAMIARLGRVDGAILVGVDGRCHAFGVILDGTAADAGDRARGSRFNSAVGYQNSAPSPAVVVVISDDNSIDLLPDLRPRVYRSSVDSAVDQFLRVCAGPNVDGERFAETHDEVMRLKFYLSQEDCELVTTAYEAEMDRRLASGGIKLNAPPLDPDPAMNNSYFLLEGCEDE